MKSLATDISSSETALVASKGKFNSRNINKPKTNDQKSSSHRFVCYNCGKRGHFAQECMMPKKKHNLKPKNMLAFSVALKEHDEEAWILDSGASMHMTFKRDYFCELNESPYNNFVKLGNQQNIKVCGEGTILINKQVNGTWEICKLENVLYVPELRRNLFSEGAATRKGYIIIKNNTEAMIMKNNVVVLMAHLTENNLFELNVKTIKKEYCNIVQTDIKVWHERLGHLNVKELQNMCKNGVIPVKLTGNQDFVCEACQYGKQARRPFMKSTRGPTEPGEIVYSDVCGPIEEPSVSGMKYFVLFKDGATSYRHVYFMKHKSEVFQYFLKYNAMVVNKFKNDLQKLHTDNGCEYVNQEFKSFLESKGIQHERTAPYTPQQNGRAEREMRSIMETARTMLYAKNIPLNMWAEAVNCAVYLLNRNTSSQTGNVTPFELWHGVKPNLHHIRIFGCVGYVHTPKEKRKKLSKKSVKMLLVGYDHDNYRMYDQNTKKITVSRDVKFDEHSTLEEKQNLVELTVEQNENQSTSQDEFQHVINQENTIPEEISSDDSMKSSEDLDETYVPPRNIHLDQNEQRNITLRPRRNNNIEANFTEFEIPNTYQEAMNSPNSDLWKKAIAEELQSHKENQTWILTDRTEKKPVSCKWVFTIKKNKYGEIERFKARLCARGFTQTKGFDFNETFSPTCRYDSIRVVLSIAARDGLQIEQFDVKTAFLYGELSEEIYMEVPEGLKVQSSKVCKLIKSIYGLKQSSRCWNEKFSSFLYTCGFVPCPSDNCVFVAHYKDVKVILIIYVDDGLLFAKDKVVLSELINILKQKFEIKVCNCDSFIGMEICRENDYISISQKQYIQKLINKFNLLEAKSCSTPADVNVHLSKNTCNDKPISFPYREAVGALLFLSLVSRPDIAYAVNVVSRYVNDPGPSHVTAVKRIFRYLIHSKDLSIVYHGNHELVGYSDSDYAGDLDTRKSNTGYIFLFNGGPVTWSSRKQNTVALSTTESEYMAASEAAKEILWLRQFLYDIKEPQGLINLYVDNQSAIKLINNPVFHRKSKHIDIKYNFVRENVAKKIIDIKYVDTSNQLADFLTKALPVIKFNTIRDKMMKYV